MSVKNSVSFNIKAKKKCDADDMIAHLENELARLKSDNIIFPHNSKMNISSPDIFKKYTELTERIEEIKGKKIQKNANHYLEGVLAFSFEKYEEDPEKFRKGAPELIEKYMEQIKEQFGFEPVGFSLHFDEGSIDENGKEIINVHAHCSFINFDFEQEKARFREIQKKYVTKRKYPNENFVKMQDMAGDCFRELGFERGITKKITQEQHLEKIDFVEKKLQAKLDEKNNIIIEKDKTINEQQNKINKLNKKGLSKVEQVKKINSKIDNAENQVVEVKKIGQKTVKDIKKIRVVLESENEEIELLKNERIEIDRENKILKHKGKTAIKKIKELEENQNRLISGMKKIVSYIGNLSTGFFNLIQCTKEQNQEKYTTQMNDLVIGFDELKQDIFDTNEKTELDEIIENAIDNLPTDEELSDDIIVDIKTSIKYK